MTPHKLPMHLDLGYTFQQIIHRSLCVRFAPSPSWIRHACACSSFFVAVTQTQTDNSQFSMCEPSGLAAARRNGEHSERGVNEEQEAAMSHTGNEMRDYAFCRRKSHRRHYAKGTIPLVRDIPLDISCIECQNFLLVMIFPTLIRQDSLF